MKVGSIDGTNNNQMQMRIGTDQDNQLQAIEKQITDVQNQIQKISENKNMSDEQKAERRKELQQQLQDLNKQLMERKIEIQKEKREKNAKTNGSNNNTNSKDTTEFSVEGLISASNAMKQIKTTNTVKTSMEGEARVLKSEIKMDKSRGVNTDNKESRLAKVNEKISDITEDINKQIKDISSTLGKVENKEKEENNDEKKDDTTIMSSIDLEEKTGYHSIDVKA